MAEEPQVGFVTMGQAAAEGDVPSIGIGMLGYAFMGKAHTNALKKMAYRIWPPPYIPRLVAISGRDEKAVAEAARRYGYETYSTRWEDVVANPDVQVFDNGGPNDVHLEPTVAAAKAGKHIICEKPLGRDRGGELRDLEGRRGDRRQAQCAFNYRFFPAIRLAKLMIDAGEIGEIYHFRGRYHQEWVMDPQFPKVWRLDKARGGVGRARRSRRARHRPVALPHRRAVERDRAAEDVHHRPPRRHGRRRRRVPGDRRVRERRQRDVRGDALRAGPQEPDAVGDQRLEGHASCSTRSG